MYQKFNENDIQSYKHALRQSTFFKGQCKVNVCVSNVAKMGTIDFSGIIHIKQSQTLKN